MQIKTRHVHNVLVFDMEGRLERLTSGDTNDEMTRIIKDSDNKMILLNFKGLEYVSSSGLSVILLAAKLAESSHRKIKVCEAKGEVKQVMEITGFNNLLPVYESEKEGITSFEN